jgi:hypothetical protein
MALSVKKFNHDWIITGIWVTALLLMTFVNCASFLRTGTVTGENTLMTVAIVTGAIWHARKL